MTRDYTAHWTLPGMARLVAVAVILMLAIAVFGAPSAYATDSADDDQMLTIQAASVSKDKKAQKDKQADKGKKTGNCDKFIGLGKGKMVFAIGKTSVAIYKGQSSSSSKITWYQRRSCVVVDTKGMKRGKNYQWLKVKLRGKQRGYVKASNVKLVVIDTKTFGLDVSKKQNERRAKICRFGLRFLGVPYSHHSGKIWKTTDCGGFVRTCLFRGGGYKHIRSGNLYKLSRQGKATTRKNLKPGDILFYPGNGRFLGHGAVYIGKGLIMNSSGAFGHYYPRGGIRVSCIDYRSPGPGCFRNIVGN